MSDRIDRRRLVERHSPRIRAAHPSDALTVGNGDLAMTVDITGLQTFPGFHELRDDPRRVADPGLHRLPPQPLRAFDRDDYQIPLRIQSTWGWYATRGRRDYSMAETETLYPTARGPVPYPDRMGLERPEDPIPPEREAGAWLHFNPRRLHLGRLTFAAPAELGLDGPEALASTEQHLDLIGGTIHSRFELADVTVVVTTVADPESNAVAVRVESDLLRRGLRVEWVFDPQKDRLAPFELPLEAHTTWTSAPHEVVARRQVESTTYSVRVTSSGALTLDQDRVAATTTGDILDVVVELRPGAAGDPSAPPSFSGILDDSRAWWQEYWATGGAVSFEGSTDPRAHEIERRVVLSQYLTAVNCAGSTPPQETGLTYNSWTGKFHLEMHWWHAAHFPMWGRGRMLERSLDWYHHILPVAEATARRQGYRGARWPKQTSPDARESPSNIGVFLIWQQPHLLYLLELLWHEGRDNEFLRRHLPLVQATAEFMADFVQSDGERYVLPPPLIPAQESYLADRATTADPTFELAYWAWGLRVANEWRRRVGLAPRSDWDTISSRMSSPHVLDDGTYAAVATPPYLIREDHPSMLMALGFLPKGALVDRSIMRATFDAVLGAWDRQSTWGWDYPVMAMTAAALGDVTAALDCLSQESPKNVFLPNGHNPQMPGLLSIYLPANGGTLAAVAHVVAAVNAGAVLPDGWVIAAEDLALPITGE